MRSSRALLTAAGSWRDWAVSWRDFLSPRRAALPRRAVRRAPAASSHSPIKAITPTAMPYRNTVPEPVTAAVAEHPGHADDDRGDHDDEPDNYDHDALRKI